MRSGILSLFTIILTVSGYRSLAIEFDRSVPMAQRQIIENDLENLCRLLDYDLENESIDKMKDMFEIDQMDCLQLRAWLEERIHLIVKNEPGESIFLDRVIVQKGNAMVMFGLEKFIKNLFSGVMESWSRFLDTLFWYLEEDRYYAMNLGSILFHRLNRDGLKEGWVFDYQHSTNYFR